MWLLHLEPVKMTPYSFKSFMTLPQSVLTAELRGRYYRNRYRNTKTKQSVGSKKSRENRLKAYDYTLFHF